MTNPLTESVHAAEFIISEANGHRSRENGTLASGQNLAAGAVVMFSGDNLTAYTAGAVTDGGTDEAAGILINAVDASTAAQPCCYIARDAEVNLNLLTYPAESTAGGEKDNTIASLKLLGIIARE
jgi:hypothetical protein